MTELKTFKIEDRFNTIEELYEYLLKNIEVIEKVTGIQIEKPLEFKPFCVAGKEQITERNILFFASENKIPGDLGELIVLSGTVDADIIVFFLPKISKIHFKTLNWLQKICNEDTQFIVGEAVF